MLLCVLRTHISAYRRVRWSSSVTALGKSYEIDGKSNIRESILSFLGRNVYLVPNHPISILNSLVRAHFGHTYTVIPPESPVVTPAKNFDSLSFPQDHPGRQVSDSYYINKTWMLRTHTSAHEVDIFSEGHKRWLFTADVYRRDEIDASHHPVFHQMEGACLWSTSEMRSLEEENARLDKELSRQDIIIEDLSTIGHSNPLQTAHDAHHAHLVAANLKHSLNGLMLKLFKGDGDEPLKVRWIDAHFPFTSPSFEVEVFYHGKWLEILGCGVVAQSTLNKASIKNELGWAFGLGLERIAMVLFQIPDIRLFWTNDERFLAQFQPGYITKFKPYSKYPPIDHDISFWLPLTPKEEKALHENDLCDTVRDVAGDLVEDVKLVDDFVHPKTGRRSQCYRIHYRSMNRTLTQQEVNTTTAEIKGRLEDMFGVEIR
ncbi:phenylalanyl-tRNA synthetase [Hysterangium stoloniferum]|nr:phenylalanyl-tRNA synthetase [Hysterangium stoloniferum]